MKLILEKDIRDAIKDLLRFGPATYREIADTLGLNLRTVKVVVRDHFEDTVFIQGDVVALATFWRRADRMVTLASIHTGHEDIHTTDGAGRKALCESEGA